jgi:hypothetical protein
MTELLKEYCNKIVLTLEGGYNLDQTAHSLAKCVKVLLGEKAEDMKKDYEPNKQTMGILEEVKEMHKGYWDFSKTKKNLIKLKKLEKKLNEKKNEKEENKEIKETKENVDEIINKIEKINLE